MSLAQKLKSIIKGKEVKVNTFGTDPLDPWSTKAGLAEGSVGQTESGLLKRYLLSRGIDPRYVTKDTRISHSKSGEFLKWKQEHMSEAVDNKDTITFDIPLLIRVLEFAREDLKTDIDLHKMVERLLAIRGKGTLTMDQYGRIIKEEFSDLSEKQINEISAELQHSYFKKAYAQKNDKTVPKATRQKRNVGMNKVVNRTLRRNTISTPGASQDFKDQEAKRGIGHVRDHVEVEGAVVEAKEANYGGDYQSSVLAVKAKAEKKPVDMKSLAARMQASYAKDEKKPVKEEVLIEAPNPKEVSKSARIIKSIYKKQGVSKDNQVMKNTDLTDKPQAAAVLSGGKTMTGSPRDTIEIDPMLRKPKGVDLKNPPNTGNTGS